MYQLPIYAAEKADGLELAIRSGARFAYSSAIDLAPSPAQIDPVVQEALNRRMVTAGAQDFDLHYLKTILVSTGWNNNDDIFDPVEVWAARATPEDKPFNYEHNCSDIIGHIVSNEVIDEQGKVLASDLAIDDLPSKFHVATSAVLYKFWAKAELQERMDLILAEIAEGKWFVSMECLMHGFDYGLIDDLGNARVIARNNQTAFLTKHLRVYGGKGVYGSEKIGRLPRNFVFSGKGLVKKPANPESVILASIRDFITTTPAVASTVYSQTLEQSTAHNPEEIVISMASETDNTVRELAEARDQVAKLQEQIRTSDVKAVQAKASDLETKLKDTETRLGVVVQEKETVEASLKKVNDELVAAQAKLTAVELAKAETDKQLATIETARRLEARTTQVSAKLGYSAEEATQTVADLADLSDEKFTSHLDRLKAAADKVKAAAAPTGTTTKKPDKKTPGKEAPKSTPAKVAAAETDEVNADPENLEGAEPEVATASLATEGVTSGVRDVQRSIAAYFGKELPEDEEK